MAVGCRVAGGIRQKTQLIGSRGHFTHPSDFIWFSHVWQIKQQISGTAYIQAGTVSRISSFVPLYTLNKFVIKNSSS